MKCLHLAFALILQIDAQQTSSFASKPLLPMPSPYPRLAFCTSLLAALALTACGGAETGSNSGSATPTAQTSQAANGTMASDQAQPGAADPGVLRSDGSLVAAAPDKQALAAVVDDPAAVEVGGLLFHDPRLSANGKTACGSCHIEGFGHADAPGTKLPLGGASGTRSGMRPGMTAPYLNLTPPFRLSLLGTPSGGYLWDGRADSHFEQAFHGGPFFNPVEMALPGSATAPKALTDLVRSAPYWPQLQALYANAPQKMASDTALFKEVTLLLETYQRVDADHKLFDSKFDQVKARTASFSAAEQRGWALFNDSKRGNCVSCHSASLGQGTALFTNFGYGALGVPRNHAGPKNADPAFYDLGICARKKAVTNTISDVLVKLLPRYCGLFKTPTLRNVERTGPYFHNAGVQTLEAAVRFHFERDTQAAKWYRKADGSADVRYNDLPRVYQGNLAQGVPFNGSFKPTSSDIADLMAFLKTLNDADQTEPMPN